VIWLAPPAGSPGDTRRWDNRHGCREWRGGGRLKRIGEEAESADEFAPDRVEDGGEKSSPAAAIEMESNVSEITAEPSPEGDSSFIGKKKRARSPQ